VNVALAMELFDPIVHQPHPLGHYLYARLARAVSWLVPDVGPSMAAIGVVASVGAAAAIYALGKNPVYRDRTRSVRERSEDDTFGPGERVRPGCCRTSSICGANMQAKKWIRWVLRPLLAVAILIWLNSLVALISPLYGNAAALQVSAVLAYVLGDADICTFRQALRAPATSLRQNYWTESVKKACRHISTDPEGYALWRTPKGNVWFPRESTSALHVDMAEQQREIYNIGGKGVAAGDVVLDCGANVGLYTREALANRARLVVAIEPAPENLECLRRNLAAEIRAGKVIVYPKGVWDKEDSLLLHRAPGNSAANSVVNAFGGSSVSVALTTIDLLVDELALDRVDFIKMDIEGAERQALSGAANTIRRFEPRMAVAAYHLPDDSIEIPRRVLAALPGYRSECSCIVNGPLEVVPEVIQFYR
jgi:FkbM family methyltransferase